MLPKSTERGKQGSDVRSAWESSMHRRSVHARLEGYLSARIGKSHIPEKTPGKTNFIATTLPETSTRSIKACGGSYPEIPATTANISGKGWQSAKVDSESVELLCRSDRRGIASTSIVRQMSPRRNAGGADRKRVVAILTRKHTWGSVISGGKMLVFVAIGWPGFDAAGTPQLKTCRA